MNPKEVVRRPDEPSARLTRPGPPPERPDRPLLPDRPVPPPNRPPPRKAPPPYGVHSDSDPSIVAPRILPGIPMPGMKAPPIYAPMQRNPSSGAIPAQEDDVDYAATKTTPPGEIVKEGSLMKKGQKRRNWVTRWFVLKHKYLFYYVSQVDKKLKGVIKLSNCCVQPYPRKAFSFTINCRLRTYFICASNNQEQEEWINAINSCIDVVERNATLIDKNDDRTSVYNLGGKSSGPSRPISSTPETPEDKLKRCIQKYFASEKSYIQTLTSLKSYKFNMLKDPMFSKYHDQIQSIFSNVEDIYKLHSGLLGDLESVIQNWPNKSIGLVVLHACAQFEVYLRYVANYSYSLEQVASLKKNGRSYQHFFKAQEQMDMSGFTLESLLSLPLQRPAQFELFIADLLDKSNRTTPDYKNIESASNKIIELSSQVDKGSALSQNVAKNIQIRKKIVGLEKAGVNLLDSERAFVKEGSLSIAIESMGQPGIPKAEYYCFLFSDLLLTTQDNPFSKRLPSGMPTSLPTSLTSLPSLPNAPKHRYFAHYFLHRYRLVELPDGFQLTDGKTQINVSVDSQKAKSEWISEIQRHMIQISRSKKVFGVALSDLMNYNERERGRDIPVFIEKAVNFIITHALNIEGIFRLSGKVSEIQEFKDQLDTGKDVDFPPSTDPHVICGLLKLWFRELPEPVIPLNKYQMFIKTKEIPNLPGKIAHLKQQVLQLPRHNQFLLEYMVSFFLIVVEYADSNKMHKRNLSIVFAPNLLNNGDPMAGAADLESVYEVFMVMVDNYKMIFSSIEEERNITREKLLREQEYEQEKQQKEKQAMNELMKQHGGFTSASANHVDKIVRQGWLSKKGAQRRNWNTRWFVLRYKSLGYYKTAQDINSVPKGKVILSAGTVVRPDTSPNAKPFSFQIECPNRVFYITAKNAQELKEWIADIESCIEK